MALTGSEAPEQSGEVKSVKQLIFVNGPMGVGKSAVCERLYRLLPGSVWLDGDGCWMMHPFRVNEENKQMVEDNIVHLLRNFLQNSSLQYVIFSWVMHQEAIVQSLLARLWADSQFELHRISLVCSPETLQERLSGRGTPEVWERAAARLPLYREQQSICLETDSLSLEQIAQSIIRACGLSVAPVQ